MDSPSPFGIKMADRISGNSAGGLLLSWGKVGADGRVKGPKIGK